MGTYNLRSIALLAGIATLLLSACGGKDPNADLQAALGQSQAEAQQLRDMAAHVRDACAQKSAQVQQMLAASLAQPAVPAVPGQPPSSNSGAIMAAMLGGGGASGGSAPDTIDGCTSQLTQYFVLAKSIEQDRQNALTAAGAAVATDRDNAWATNAAYRTAAIQLVAQQLHAAAGNAALNPYQLLQVAQQYGSQIPQLASQFGLSPADIAPLMQQVNSVQSQGLALLASGQYNGTGVIGGVPTGNLNINGGTGIGIPVASVGIGAIPSTIGYGATSGTGSLGIGLGTPVSTGIASTGTTATSGTTGSLNLFGARAATEVTSLNPNDGAVLNLKARAATFFTRHTVKKTN